LGFTATNRRVLLLHDGELEDVRRVVAELGAEVVEASGARDADDSDCALVVSTARHLPELSPRPVQPGRRRRRRDEPPRAVRITVAERDAQTLRALMRRAGVELLVRRPVHPAALRLLLLHALYRGPERRERRVAVGAPVRLRAGLRKRPAILADLSATGCLLIASHAAQPGHRLTVHLPESVDSARMFAVRARVVRTSPVEGDDPGALAIACAFESLSRAITKKLRSAVSSFLEGPARLPASLRPAASEPVIVPEVETSEEDSATASAEASPGVEAVDGGAEPAEILLSSDLIVHAEFDDEEEEDEGADPATEALLPLGEATLDPAALAGSLGPEFADPSNAGAADDSGRAERRRAPRRAYERRVVALGAQAARVLIGRDLSPEGMRVGSAPSLALGQDLRVALHASGGETPLVLRARLDRDDGERGMLLRFVGLDDGARQALAKMMDSLPVLDAGCDEANGSAGVVVSEIVGEGG
jgi:PilZ domain